MNNEMTNEIENKVDDIFNKIENAIYTGSKMPNYNSILFVFNYLNGFTVNIIESTKYYDKKIEGMRYVATRNELKGKYIEIFDTFNNKVHFSGFTRDTNFTFNLAHSLLKTREL